MSQTIDPIGRRLASRINKNTVGMNDGILDMRLKAIGKP